MDEPRHTRSIVHLDADAFFVGCEVSSNPRLAGKPVAVGGTRRGIVASASYEARKLGVYTPMPTSRAKALCPDLIVLPADFVKYGNFSKRMFSILEDYTPFVERGSIDEGFGDLSGVTAWTPLEAAKMIKRDIRDKLGLSVSVGLASNKLVSSVASKLNKPDGFAVVPEGAEREFLAGLGVEWLPGVGKKMAEALRSAGFVLIGDIAAASPETLNSLVGSSAPLLGQYARGLDDRPVETETAEAKSYGRQETFGTDTSDGEFVRLRLRGMADELMAKVRAEGKTVRGVEVKVRYRGMEQNGRSMTLPSPTDLETDVYGAVDLLLEKAWVKSKPLRLVGLKLFQVGEMKESRQQDLGLFGHSELRRQALAKAMDEVRSKYGEFAAIRAHRLWEGETATPSPRRDDSR